MDDGGCREGSSIIIIILKSIYVIGTFNVIEFSFSIKMKTHTQ